jgi:hypothetical protein
MTSDELKHRIYYGNDSNRMDRIDRIKLKLKMIYPDYPVHPV